MGQALYRKYRSKSLSEVIGQEHITRTLENTLKKQAVSHAYLFTGPRGVGKTSVARILAHEINNIPYSDDSMHLDIIEIDAASNRRIDEIRDLRDKVNIVPTSAAYKVYIIDEVHMLTREAFNALLKTLEEPPKHVVFILATTEAHKLPETIISRTQRFIFKPIDPQKVIDHLRDIATTEHIDIDDAALALIAEHGEGSFRDSISLLDQASGRAEKIDAALVQSLLGIAPAERISELLDTLETKNLISMIESIRDIRAQGYDAVQIARQLQAAIRERVVTGTLRGGQWFSLMEKLLTVPATYNPEQYFEIVLLEFTSEDQQPQASPPATKLPQQSDTATKAKPAATATHSSKQATSAVTAESIAPPSQKTEVHEQAPTSKKPQTEVEPSPELQPSDTASAATTALLDEALWPEVIAAVKKKYNTLYGIIRMARPEFGDATVTLHCKFSFHQKRLKEPKNQKIVVDTIKQLTGKNFRLECLVETSQTDTKKPEKPSQTKATTVPTSGKSVGDDMNSSPNATTNPVATISNIFGGAELLES